ncbi:lipoprotein [Klebsiella pneumoniae]|nr:lipoprotein [Klebsiella pneumoniae]
MKKLLAILPLVLAGCAQPQPTAPTKTIGMPNPAAVYCQQSGGTRVPVQTPQGVSTQCKLPTQRRNSRRVGAVAPGSSG